MNTISDKIKEATKIVANMTLEEKASLLSGKDFWSTKSIDRLNVPSFMLTDGPHGLRKQEGDSDHLGLNLSVPATCFPPAATTACSFDTELMYEMGVALGEECVKNNVSVLLGPAINIKRNPLCGRNFEYISEDPYLAGEMAAELVNGIQSKNVGVSVKHYLANSQEKRRLVSDSIVDERTLREIYMSAFETVVKKSQPWTMMCSYNKINGVYASDNKRLMSDIPRGEWKYQGAIVSDWGAINDRVEAVKAGLDLEMPSSGGIRDKEVVKAVKNGKLDENDLDRCAIRLVALALKRKNSKPQDFDEKAHNELARKIAAESAVLLKNDDNLLPFNKKQKLALVGSFAKKPRYQGAGSSRINPISVNCIFDEFAFQDVSFTYSKGYKADTGETDEDMINEAVENAKEASAAIVVVGLPDDYESEGYDRKHILMPAGMNKLVQAVVAANKNTAVVLLTGSVVYMPWRNDVKSILLAGLTGQNNGGAIFDLLFGLYSPSGKLAESYPLTMEDAPSHHDFGKDEYIIKYRESVFVGYRYYSSVNRNTQFPFGHGLSYTQFEYADLITDKKEINDTDTLTVSVDIKNIGKCDAKEVVQLYVSPKHSTIFRPVRELKGFTKLFIEQNKTEKATFTLNKRSFAFYNVNINDWCVETGEYEIQVCASADKVLLSTIVTVKNTDGAVIPDYKETAPAYYNLSKDELFIPLESFEGMLGHSVPKEPSPRPFHLNSTLRQIETSLFGRMVAKIVKKQAIKMLGGGDNSSDDVTKMLDAMLYDMPLRGATMFLGEKFTLRQIEGFANFLDGKIFRGLFKMFIKKC